MPVKKPVEPDAVGAGEAVQPTDPALAESELRYRTIFENTGTAMMILEEDTSISMANRQAEILTGYRRDELAGRSWTEFVVAEDLVQMREYHDLRRRNAAAAPNQYEFGFLDRHGNRREIQLTIDVIPGTKRSVASLIDATDHKRALAALRVREAQFRALVETSPDVIWEVDSMGIINYVSPQATTILGYDPQELIWRPFLSVVSGETRRAVRRMIAEILRRPPEFFNTEMEVVAEDGKHVLLEIRSSQIVDDRGTLAGFRGTARDITAEKEVEQALRESEERFKLLFEYAPDAYYLLDDEGIIVDGNRAAEEMIGYRIEELIGTHVFDANILSVDQIQKAAEMLGKNSRGVETGPEELTLIDRNGMRVEVETRTHPLKIGNRNLILGIARDITARRRDEEAIRNSEAKLKLALAVEGSGIWEWDLQANRIYIDQRLAERLGMAPDEGPLMPSEWEGLTHAADRPHVQKALLAHLRGETPAFEVDQRMKHRGGHYLWARTKGMVIARDSGGRPLWFIGTAKDITALKQSGAD
jgi:PAS domain S-box-containing protein